MIDLLIKSALKLVGTGRKASGCGCPDNEQMALYVEGRLPAMRQEAMERHLLDCDGCMATLSISASITENHEFAAKTNLADVIISFFKQQVSVISNIADLIPTPMPEPALVRDPKVALRSAVRFTRHFTEMTGDFTIRKNGDNAADILLFLHKEDLPLDCIRVSLLRGNKEMHSLLSEKGEVAFDSCPLGCYTIRLKKKNTMPGEVTLHLLEEHEA